MGVVIVGVMIVNNGEKNSVIKKNVVVMIVVNFECLFVVILVVDFI